jgi:hypothetical protein
LAAGPENRSLCAAAESIRIKQRSVVVIAQQRNLKVEAKVNAFPRIWPVSDDVAQTEEASDSLGPNVGQDSLKRLQVTVDVTDNRGAGIGSHQSRAVQKRNAVLDAAMGQGRAVSLPALH